MLGEYLFKAILPVQCPILEKLLFKATVKKDQQLPTCSIPLLVLPS